MKRKSFIFIILLMFSLMLFSKDSMRSVKKSCSNIILKSVDGKEVKFSDYYGKKFIIIFWSVKCSHCIDEIPELKKIYKEYKDRVNFISVLMIPTDDKIKRLLKEYKLPYPVFKRNKGLEDCLWGVGYFPTIYFIDENMEVKKMTEGYKEADYLRYIIDKKLL